jgi:hypothetical protein
VTPAKIVQPDTFPTTQSLLLYVTAALLDILSMRLAKPSVCHAFLESTRARTLLVQRVVSLVRQESTKSHLVKVHVSIALLESTTMSSVRLAAHFVFQESTKRKKG